jgi:hypothetical protein
MSRLLRITVLGFAALMLASGAALAGPGGRNSSGDPEVPMGTQPRVVSSEKLASRPADASVATTSPVVDVRGQRFERSVVQRRALQLLLELSRVFVLR